MTNDEAIQILADLIDNPFLHTWEEQNKALHMAIEALSADSVSREGYEEVKAYMDTLVDAFIEDGEELAKSVKVVRCKDCKHWASAEDYDCEIHSGAFGADDFCSYGERREEGEVEE